MLIQMYGASQLCLPDVEIQAGKLDDIQCLRNTYRNLQLGETEDKDLVDAIHGYAGNGIKES